MLRSNPRPQRVVTVNRTLQRTAPLRLFEVVVVRTGAPLVLAGLMLLAFVFRTWLNGRVEAPWIMADELTYSEMAKSFASGEGFEVRGLPPSTRTLYPALISPAWLFDSVQTAFSAAKAINTVAMTLACVPLYLWARRILSEGWALAAATLLLLLPAFAYTGTIMTESASLPLFLLALYAFARALESPTSAWQIAAVAAVLPAVAVRVQGLVLFPVLVSAIILDSLIAAWAGAGSLRRFVARLRVFAVTGAALLVLMGAYVTYALVSYKHLADGLSGYSGLADLDFSLREGFRWTLIHAGELVIAVGFLPASAFLLLAAGWMRRDRPPAERAFVCVTAAALLWIVPAAGFFASRYSQRIEERNMFYVEPLLLLALVAWVARGAPRPPRATAVAVVIPAALLTTIPFERLFNQAAVWESFALLPLVRVSTLVEGGIDALRVLVALAAAAAALLLVFVPRRIAAAMIGAVGLFLGLSAWSVSGALRDQAHRTHLEAGSAEASWIDSAVGRRAEAPFIFTTDLAPNPHLLWQTEFWNRSVGNVYLLDAVNTTGLPAMRTTIDGRGRVVSVEDGKHSLFPRYVVAQPSVGIAGDEVAHSDRLVLYRIRGPLRIEHRVDGIFSDGWSGSDATYTNFAGDPGTVRVEVGRPGWGGPDIPGMVTIDVQRLDTGRRVTVARWVVHNLSKRTLRLRAPAAPFRVDVRTQPTFSPSQYGFGDQRQLGAQVAFGFEGH
jgi:hypothetical protein